MTAATLAVAVAALSLAERTEAELIALMGASTDTADQRALAAEIERREQAAREWRELYQASQPAGHAAAGRVSPARLRWAQARMAKAEDVERAWLAAEAATNGYMLNAAGQALARAGKLTERELFTGPLARALKYASAELIAHWETHPRPTAAMRQGYDTRVAFGSAGDAHARKAAERDQWRDRAGRDGEQDMSVCRQHSSRAGTPRACRDCPLSTRKAGQTMNAGANFTAAAARAATTPAGGTAGPDAAETRRRERLARIERAREVLARREAELNAAAPAAVPARAVAARPGTALATRAGRGSVDGARVLGYARQLLTRYARFPSAAAADAATLWAAHAHARDKDGTLVWQATPRLMLLSSEPGSGKSRVLELLGWLCPSTFGLDTEPTAAGLAWTLSAEHATGLIDEADVLFGAGKRRESIRAILNSGYRRNGTILRMRGGKGERQRVFGPVALAGLDVLQTSTGESLAPLFSRAIVVRMRKAAEAVPPLDREGCAAAARIRTALALWTAGVRDEAAQAQPGLPAWLMNRPAEIWTPLLAIADAAGSGWPERAREACEELARYSDIAGERDDDDDIMAGLAGITAGWDDDRDY